MHIDELPGYLQSLADQRGAGVIILDGQVCSGKTTTATKLVEELTRRGRMVDRFNVDWFIIDRDKRTYRTHPEFLEMARWTDENAAGRALRSFLRGEEVSFRAYDRSTGKRSLPVSIRRTPGALLVMESIYALRVAHAVGMGEERVLPFLFTAAEEAVWERLRQRRSYMDPAQVEFEAREIFFPSVRRYEEGLRARRVPFFRIDATDYSSVRVSW